jgi:general stress protein 26
MNPAETLWKLIDDTRTCMMVTEAPGAALHGRPMHVAHADPERKQIWFYTRLASGKSEDLAQDGRVCLCFARPSRGDYVSVSGQGTVDADRQMIHAHWSRFVDAWFPEGPDGDDVGMIRVDVEAGEYWDSDSSSVLAALKMMRASAADETPDLGENRKVSL